MSKRLTLEHAQKLAEKRAGKCLSLDYINNHTKMIWQCEFKHQWKSDLDHIRQGQWCPHCSGNARKELRICKDYAQNKGGDCLSIEYKNNSTKMIWKCNEGHVWMSIWGNINKGKWCPQCGYKKQGLSKRLTLIEMQELAKNRGGKCLSSEYFPNSRHLEWECSIGHKWKASPHNIKFGTWCPECSSFVSERICRAYFEIIFSEKFPKSKPNWLKTENGSRLELDGYCEKLGIAFEHQGEQHYFIGRFFSKTKKELKKIQKRDKIKRYLCEKKNIVLIEIPQLGTLLKVEKLLDFIINKISKTDIINLIPGDISVDHKSIFNTILKRELIL